MARFINGAGLILETNDKTKIECYKAKGLKELDEQPKQELVEVADEYTVKKKKARKTKAKGV